MKKEYIALSYKSNFLSRVSLSSNYDTNKAIEELIDNSIGAGAKRIDLIMDLNKHVLTVKDNGLGMDEIDLKTKYYCVGESGTKTDSDAPGAFGAGGKGGPSYLMGDNEGKVEIRTRKKGGVPLYSEWIKNIDGEISYMIDTSLEHSDSMDFGTEIKIPLYKEVNPNDLAKNIKTKYCWRMKNDGIGIYFDVVGITRNPIKLTGEDPLYRNNKTLFPDGINAETKKFIVKSDKDNKKEYEVCVSVTSFHKDLPSEELSTFDGGEPVFVQSKISNMFGIKYMKPNAGVKVANRSGIFIKTAGIYYTLGGNIDRLIGGTQHASCNGLRIEVDIPKGIWEDIGITWNKSSNFKPFYEIPMFRKYLNVIDKETEEISVVEDKDCVYSYISSLIANFKSENDEYRKKLDKKGENLINKIRNEISLSNVHPKIANDSESFVTRNEDEIIFNLNKCRFGKLGEKEAIKFIEPILTIIDNSNDIDGLIGLLNEEYNER